MGIPLKPGFHPNARNARSVALRALHASRKRKPQATQALALATMIGCFDRVFLLAGACVRCVKNRICSVVAISYAMTACISCVTCARVFVFFACVIFLRLLRFLCTFYFACVFFSYARPCVRCVRCMRLNGTGLESVTHGQFSSTPDLRLPSQPQSLTAQWPVPNYTAW